MQTMEKPKQQVSLGVKLNRNLREKATQAANKQGVSVRQIVLTVLQCLIENDIDLSLREIIEKAKANTSDRTWRNRLD